MRRRFYWLTIAVLLLDHATKWLVQSRLDLGRSIELIPGYLRLAHVQNSGVAFGLFRDVDSPWKPWVLAGLAVLAVAWILVYSARMPVERVLLQVALAITTGGILGNFIDRVTYGFVTDFIEFHIREAFYWPTFNVADSSISVGIALLLIDIVKNPEPRQTDPVASPEPPAAAR